MSFIFLGIEDWPEPTCEELLKAEQKRTAELQAQVNNLSLRIQEDITDHLQTQTLKELNHENIL